MFLLQPRHELARQGHLAMPFTQLPFYDVATWRDARPSLFSKSASETFFALIGCAALVESIARLPLGLIAALFSSKHLLEGSYNALKIAAFSLYALFLNLFAANVTQSLAHFQVWMQRDPELCLAIAAQYGEEEMVKYLLSIGANPHKQVGPMPPALYPTFYQQPHLAKYFPLTSKQKYSIQKNIDAHWHNRASNGGCSPFYFSVIHDALVHFFLSHDEKITLNEKSRKTLEDALNFNSNTRFYHRVVKRIHENTLTFIDSGWKNHGICLCFYGDLLAIGNRGQGSETAGTLCVFKINPKKVDAKMIEKIKSQSANTPEEGIVYFYQYLPKILSPDGSIIPCKEFCKIAPKQQKSGNCALTSKKSALRFAWAQLLSEQGAADSMESARTESKLFTDWAASQLEGEHPTSQKWERYQALVV